MHFRLAEELEMIRETVREFASDKVAPTARERDEEERFDRKLFEQLGQMGLTGIPWPELNGGAGGDYAAFAVVVEELSRVCASTGAGLAAHIAHCGCLIYKFGSTWQKQTFLKAIAEGKLLGTCIYPHNGRNDIGANKGIAVRKAADGYILDGICSYVDHAGAADIYIVFAQGLPGKRNTSYSAFVVDSKWPGLHCGPKMRKLGMRSMTTGTIHLENCLIPHANLIGREGQGREIALSMQDVGSIGSAAQAVGIAQGAMEAAVAYAKERRQFGKPISQQQGILFKLADMSAKIESARLLTYEAAWRIDAGLPYRKQAALAALFAVRAAEFVTVEAVQVFGGYGYMREYQVERYMRDAKYLAAEAGAREYREDFIRSVFT
jgi:butyryl-CoA dehydrogenase